MIRVKFKLDATNWLEVTWIDIEQHEIHVPAKEAVLDEDGNIVCPEEPAYTTLSDPIETELKHTSYHPTQLDMLISDVIGVPVSLDEVIGEDITISNWAQSYIPPEPEPEEVPLEISAAQAQIALLSIGLLDEVESMMSHPDTPREHKIAWNKAQVFRRDSPTMLAMAGVLNITEEQLDVLFIQASKIIL